MPPDRRSDSGCDLWVIFLGILVFSLPLTLLVPDFCLWDVVPKFRVSRFHILTDSATWYQLNTAAVVLLTLFFGLFLEIRRRKLDDMVRKVIKVSRATHATMDKEKTRHVAAIRDCMVLLDVSQDQYENLALLGTDLRHREVAIAKDLIKNNGLTTQRPPMIEPSSIDI